MPTANSPNLIATLEHVTHYQYDQPVLLGPQLVRLRPAPHSHTHILSYSLEAQPAHHYFYWQQDAFANYMARLVFSAKSSEFKLTVRLKAQLSAFNPFDFFLEPSVIAFPFFYDAVLAQDLAPYLLLDPNHEPAFQQYLKSIATQNLSTLDFLVQLNQKLHRDIAYTQRMEHGVQTPAQTVQKKSGSCRDSAWLGVQILRHFGVAARFVSGYLIEQPSTELSSNINQTATRSSDLHAWYEAYLPGAGWIGFDATSGLLAGQGHIALACTPRPSSAAPVEGWHESATAAFKHSLNVHFAQA